VITVPTPRNCNEAVNPRIKSLNYLNNILAKIEANLAGTMEAMASSTLANLLMSRYASSMLAVGRMRATV